MGVNLKWRRSARTGAPWWLMKIGKCTMKTSQLSLMPLPLVLPRTFSGNLQPPKPKILSLAHPKTKSRWLSVPFLYIHEPMEFTYIRTVTSHSVNSGNGTHNSSPMMAIG